MDVSERSIVLPPHDWQKFDKEKGYTTSIVKDGKLYTIDTGSVNKRDAEKALEKLWAVFKIGKNEVTVQKKIWVFKFKKTIELFVRESSVEIKEKSFQERTAAKVTKSAFSPLVSKNPLRPNSPSLKKMWDKSQGFRNDPPPRLPSPRMPPKPIGQAPHPPTQQAADEEEGQSVKSQREKAFFAERGEFKPRVSSGGRVFDSPPALKRKNVPTIKKNEQSRTNKLLMQKPPPLQKPGDQVKTGERLSKDQQKRAEERIIEYLNSLSAQSKQHKKNSTPKNGPYKRNVGGK